MHLAESAGNTHYEAQTVLGKDTPAHRFGPTILPVFEISRQHQQKSGAVFTRYDAVF